MNEYLMIGIIIVLLGAVAALVKIFLKQRSDLKRYSPIKSIESEVKSIQAEMEKSVRLGREDMEKSARRKKELDAEIGETRTILDRLKDELRIFETKKDMLDVGMFEPIFDFADSEEYQREIIRVKEQQKTMIKNKSACSFNTNWVVDGSLREGAKMTKNRVNLGLRAFNGESDALIAKVRWNNVENFVRRIESSYSKINKMGEVMQVKISYKYLQLKIKELHLVYGKQYKLRQEAEERRDRAVQLREEEKAQREIAKAIMDAEAEEGRNQRALDKARAEYERRMEKKDAHLDEYLARVRDLESKLKEAMEMRERMKSRAQMTKSGYVYIVSNIGSFGESVYKIGMTRRLDPNDRVRELGDASVPFLFDKHAIVFSDDAPRLEGELHKKFADRRVNRVNMRKEFFKVSPEEIRASIQDLAGDIDFIVLPEAEEYRETLSIIARESHDE